MIWLAVVLSLLLVASVWLNIKAIKANLLLSDQRESLVDVIEESLDELDDVYTRIAHAAEIPVLSDEPVVRNLLADIKRAKNVVLAIAGRVVVYGKDKNAEDGDE